MNYAHIHLTVNHFPIIFPMVAVIVLITGFIFKSEVMKRTAYFIFALGAISTVFAIISGEKAAGYTHTMDWFQKSLVHEHHESAEFFGIFSYILGLLSVVALWASWKGKQFSKWLSYIVLIFSFVTMFLAKNAGSTGGDIRHTEIRTEQNTVEQPANVEDEEQN
ncbi:MAG: DUF2231 domain-containing protein [Saprospiraceae bacterium]